MNCARGEVSCRKNRRRDLIWLVEPDTTRHCVTQVSDVVTIVAICAILTVVLSHVRNGLVYELRCSFTHVGDLADQEGVDDLAPETGDRLRNGKEHSSTL